jgi:uncharacterized protein (DUF1697 family)
VTSRKNAAVAGRQKYAAVLRGVNVGGRNKLPMTELRELMESLGCDGVVTYIQSGNAVFATELAADAAAGAIEELIGERFGLSVRVLLRTSDELAAIAAANPFLGRDDPAKLHVVFLEAPPDPDTVASLDPARSPGDEFTLSGREIFIHYRHGSGRSKLTLDWFERSLGVAGTARNWNTLLKLQELAAEP